MDFIAVNTVINPAFNILHQPIYSSNEQYWSRVNLYFIKRFRSEFQLQDFFYCIQKKCLETYFLKHSHLK